MADSKNPIITPEMQQRTNEIQKDLTRPPADKSKQEAPIPESKIPKELQEYQSTYETILKLDSRERKHIDKDDFWAKSTQFCNVFEEYQRIQADKTGKTEKIEEQKKRKAEILEYLTNNNYLGHEIQISKEVIKENDRLKGLSPKKRSKEVNREGFLHNYQGDGSVGFHIATIKHNDGYYADQKGLHSLLQYGKMDWYTALRALINTLCKLFATGDKTFKEDVEKIIAKWNEANQDKGVSIFLERNKDGSVWARAKDKDGKMMDLDPKDVEEIVTSFNQDKSLKNRIVYKNRPDGPPGLAFEEQNQSGSVQFENSIVPASTLTIAPSAPAPAPEPTVDIDLTR